MKAADRGTADPSGAPAARPAGRRPYVVTYIVRRLLAAVILLLIVTAVDVRDLLPGAAARRRHRRRPRLAVRRQERAAPRTSTRSRCKLGLHRPDLGAVRPLRQGASFVGADYSTGADHRALPRAVLRVLVHQPEPGAARPARPAAGHAVARGRRRGAVAGRRGQHRRALGAAPRQRVRPGGDGRRARRASRCRSSSPACCRWRSSATGWACTAPGGSYTPFEREPAAVGVRPAAAVDHAGVPLRGAGTPG